MKTKQLRINKNILNELLEIHKNLSHLLDTSEKSTCGIKKEHKEAIRVYMDSWVMPILASTINGIRGDKSALLDCKIMRQYHNNPLDKKIKKYEG